MKTWVELVFLLACCAQAAIEDSKIDRKGYLSIDNGKLIINQNIAYVHTATTRQVQQMITVRQPVTLIPLRDDIRRIQRIAEATEAKCHDLQNLAQRQQKPQDALSVIDASKPGFVLMNKDLRFKPTEVKAMCENRGYRVPEPDSQEERKYMRQLLVESGADMALIASRFELSAQTHVSPYSGQHMQELYPNIYEGVLNGELYDGRFCPYIDWTFHFVLRSSGKLTVWAPERFVHLHNGALSRWYKHFPGNDEWAKHVGTNNTCVKSVNQSQKHDKFPLICEQIPNQGTKQKELYGWLEQRVEITETGAQKSRQTRCEEIAQQAHRAASMLNHNFALLVQQIGVTDDFLYGTGTRDKRFAAHLLFGAAKAGLGAITAVSMFRDNARFKSIEAQIRNNVQATQEVKELAVENKVGLAQLREEFESQVRRMGQEMDELRVDHDLTKTHSLVNSATTLVEQEVSVFRALIQQALNGQTPQLMETVYNELKLGEALRHRYSDGRGVSIEPDTQTPVMLGPSPVLGQFEVIFNYLILGDTFEIFKIVPLPKFTGGYMYLTKALYKYMAVHLRTEDFVPMSEEDVLQCEKGQCAMLRARMPIQAEECVVSPILGDAPNIQCPVEGYPKSQMFIPTPQGLIYALPKGEKLSAHVFCDTPGSLGPDNVTHLSGLGLLAIAPGCTLSVHDQDKSFMGPPRQVFINISDPVGVRQFINYPLALNEDGEVAVVRKEDEVIVEAGPELNMVQGAVRRIRTGLWVAVGAVAFVGLAYACSVILGVQYSLNAKRYVLQLKHRLMKFAAEAGRGNQALMTQFANIRQVQNRLVNDMRRRDARDDSPPVPQPRQTADAQVSNSEEPHYVEVKTVRPVGEKQPLIELVSKSQDNPK
jgi:hypothetical protein